MKKHVRSLSGMLVSLMALFCLHACDPVVPGPIPDYSGYPVDEATGIRPTSLADDSSKLPEAPGSYEWWNFFAFDATSDLAVSMIFLSGNLWDVEYRKAVHEYRADPEGKPRPDPSKAFLLQLNVTKGNQKVFTTIKNPPDTTVDFSRTEPYGRIGNSSFYATIEDGIRTFHVHIDAPDMMNLSRLEADVEIRAASPGFAVDGLGLYGRIPGGSLHHWQFPVGYPETRGTVRIMNRFGVTTMEESFTGGGYTDHMWGEGFCGDILDSWYFGRLDLGDQGALVYIWLTPRSEDIEPYGRVFRIPRGELATMYEVLDFSGTERARGKLGLEYFSSISMSLAGGGLLQVRFGNPAVEDWPFQVAGPATVSAYLPGDIDITEQPGLGEYLWQPGIDDPLYRFLAGLLPFFPWFP